MAVLSDLWLRLRAVFRRPTVEREIDDELRFHLERQADAYVRAGMSRADAERRARLDFGALEGVKDDYRDALGVRWLDDLRRDVRYAFRALRRSPAFATTAIVSIALGVGANTLVFSVVNTLVMRPLPVSDPDQLVFVQPIGQIVAHSYPAYRDMRDANVTFDGLAGYRITMMEADAGNGPTHEWGYLVTGNYFDLLGVTPAAGRFFRQSDDTKPGGDAYAVLSYEFWQAHFGADPTIVGSTIRLNRLPYRILGVAPAFFYGTEVFYRPDIYVPMSMQAEIEVGHPWLENRNTANVWVVGRLKRGTTPEQGAANLTAISRQLGKTYATTADGAYIKLTRPGLIGDAIGAPAQAFAVGLLTLAGLVLLTACANLASTLAARGRDRRHELAVRLSIGAGRGRIVRQLLTESVVLAGIGGAVGAFGATVAARAISRWQLPIALPVQFDLHPDARVFLFAFVVSLVAGLIFGVGPARQAAVTDPNRALKTRDDVRGRRWPLREILVSVQLALCVVLVAACLISIRGLQRTLTMPFGMQPAQVTMATFDLGLAGYSRESGQDLRERALERVRTLPGVAGAAYANSLPLNIDQSSSIVYPDDQLDLPPAKVPRAVRYQTSPGYFSTLGIRLMQGRDFDARDSAAGIPVGIVNQAFARQILRTQDAIGRHFQFGREGASIEVVGIVETGKYQSLTESETPAVFLPMLQSYNTTTVLLVRSTRPSEEIATELRGVMKDLDPSMPLFGVRSVESMLGFVLLPMRVAAIALGAFGVLAAMLAMTGIHGLVAYAVANRRREIAIRLAIGASRGSVVRLIVRRVATLVLVGAAAGMLLVGLLGGLLDSVVYQRPENDYGTLGLVGIAVVLIGLAACWRPVRRILRLQPARALHAE
jgi:predicted permease